MLVAVVVVLEIRVVLVLVGEQPPQHKKVERVMVVMVVLHLDGTGLLELLILVVVAVLVVGKTVLAMVMARQEVLVSLSSDMQTLT
jgi:hypothetical protein